jgi:hypothetical protein
MTNPHDLLRKVSAKKRYQKLKRYHKGKQSNKGKKLFPKRKSNKDRKQKKTKAKFNKNVPIIQMKRNSSSVSYFSLCIHMVKEPRHVEID